MDTDAHNLEDATRDELYELAKEHDVPGRSRMVKAELIDALEPLTGQGGGQPPVASRFKSFRKLAQAHAGGEFVMLPRMLTGNDRRLHVRQTLREDHQNRISNRSDDAEAKFDKLAGSLYSFFRGTCLLFYRDLAGEDAWMPTVLTLGDVHPENFGVMPSEDNVPIFGVNDFDEAYYAPFTWDLKRGTVGFLIAAQQEGGYGRKKQRKIARKFVEGYIDGITEYAGDAVEQQHQLRIDNSPRIIAELIEDSMEDRTEWLAGDHHDEFKRGFRTDDELIPRPSRRDEFQELVDRYIKENNIDVPERAAGMRVKDVAERRGAGTASLGLARYYVMIEGPRQDATDDLVIEFKQARRSALEGLVPPSDFAYAGQGNRIAHAQAVQLVRGDVFYGAVEHDGLSFMARERAPFRNDIDLDELSKSEWKEYAEVCGHTLAHSHALSDEVGAIDHDIEPMIVAAIGRHDLFIDDIVRYADGAAERVRTDHKGFKKDHAMGAFHSVDNVYK